MIEAFSSVIGQIYDAAADPSIWPAALSQIAGLFGGLGASLIARDNTTLTGRTITTWDPDIIREFWNYQQHSPFLRREQPPRPGTVETDRDIVARPELLRGAYYNEYMRPHELHSGMILWLDCRGPHRQYLSVTRSRVVGEFEHSHVELARLLAPHLRRAMLLDKALPNGLDPGGTGEVLDVLARTVILLDRAGALVHVNRAGERLLATRDGLLLDRGRLCAATPLLTARLEAMLARAGGQAGMPPASGAMALPRPSGKAALALVAVPLRRDIDWLRPHQTAICICVTDPEQRPSMPCTWLSALFGLTAAEAAVVRALLAGREGREIGEALGISYNTVRAHLARIMGKTGTKRQAELVGLLSALATLRAQG